MDNDLSSFAERRPTYSRREVIFVVTISAITSTFVVMLHDGMPVVGALILWPLALIMIFVNGGPVVMLWGVSIAVLVALHGTGCELWRRSIRTFLLAIVAGLTPHSFFLIQLHRHRIDSKVPDDQGTLERFSSYQSLVFDLQNRFSDYLMPSVGIGVIISIILVILSFRQIGKALADTLDTVRWLGRTAGIALAAASSFALGSSFETGKWQPDARPYLEAVITVEAKAAYYDKALVELSSPSSDVHKSAVRLARQLSMLPAPVLKGLNETMTSVMRERRAMPPQTHHLDHVTRPEALEALGQLNASEDRAYAERAHAEIVGLAAALAGEVAKPVCGAILSALVEDAASEFVRRVVSPKLGTWRAGSELEVDPLTLPISTERLVADINDVVREVESTGLTRSTSRERRILERDMQLEKRMEHLTLSRRKAGR